MVGVLGDDHAPVACDRAGDAQGEIVRLGTAAGIHDLVEPVRRQRRQSLRQRDDVFVQVARVRVLKNRVDIIFPSKLTSIKVKTRI